MKSIILSVFCLLCVLYSAAQNELGEYLKAVEVNNLSLKSYRELIQTRKLEATTGLNPSDPEVEFGYLPGDVGDKGTMTTLRVSQELEFPSVYQQRNKLARLQQNEYELDYQSQRLAVLMQAGKLYLERIFLLKSLRLQAERSENARELVRIYEKSFEAGETNILEVNKLKLELLKAGKLESLTKSLQVRNEQQLLLFTSGETVQLKAEDYPLSRQVTAEELLAVYQERDPGLRLFSEQLDQAVQEIKLQRNENMPNISLNYSYEKTPEVKYAGPGVALSIPIWANKNKLKQAHSNLAFAQVKLEEEKKTRENELLEKVSQLEILQQSIKELKETLASVNSLDLLGKALESGEITIIEYLNELQYFYQIRQEYLELEYDIQLRKNELNRIFL